MTPGVARPPCPQNHEGVIWLDGRELSGGTRRFEHTRYRCVPADPTHKRHVFQGSMPARREHSDTSDCEACERPFERAQGLANGHDFTFVVREIATALFEAGKGATYRSVARELRKAIGRPMARGGGKGTGLISKSPALVLDYLDTFGASVVASTIPTTWPKIVAIDAWPIEIPDHSKCCGRARKKSRKPGEPRRHGVLHSEDRIWFPPADGDRPLILPAWETGKLGATIDDLTPELREQAIAALTQWDKPDDKNPTVDEILGKKPKPSELRKKDGTWRSRKIKHTPAWREVGAILVAVGYDHPGGPPRPWLMRFSGGRDQVSWTEFLRTLSGSPEWVVSDRETGLIQAVADVWPKAVHYFCEQHIAKNMAERATADGVKSPKDPVWAILESAQFDVERWAEAQKTAKRRRLASLSAWLAENHDLVAAQAAKRAPRPRYPRAAGGCENTIKAVKRALAERIRWFQNADRLDLLLALMRANLDGKASVAAYSKIIREQLAANDGRPNIAWSEMRDRDGVSSMLVLHVDARQRAGEAKSDRHGPRKAAYYRKRRAEYEQEREQLGLPASPRGRPRALRAQKSVVGKHVSDFWWLVEDWHPTLNGDLRPEDIPAGGGEKIWWHCGKGVGHDWPCQVRSRTMRGTGCPFCAGRKVSPAESFAVTHPDIAAQWHPTRNGSKRPEDYTYGSQFEPYWQCPAYVSHVWPARISSRTSMLSGCPDCARLAGKGGRAKTRATAEANQIA